jgi:hypothetical protein
MLENLVLYDFNIPLWLVFLIGIIILLIFWKLFKFAIKILLIIIIFFIIMSFLDYIKVFDWIQNLISQLI